MFLVVIPWYWNLQTVGVFAATGLHFHLQPLIGSLHGAKPQLLCMNPSSPELQLLLRLHLHQWSFLPPTVPSLSCSLWPLQAFKTSATWVMLTPNQVWLPAQGTTLAASEQNFSVLSGNVPGFTYVMLLIS